jgi:hypothetical protein
MPELMQEEPIAEVTPTETRRSLGATITAASVALIIGAGAGYQGGELVNPETPISEVRVAEYVAANIDSATVVSEIRDEIVEQRYEVAPNDSAIREVIARPKYYKCIDIPTVDTLRTVLYCGDNVLGVFQMPITVNPDTTKITKAAIQITIDDVVR